MKTNHWKRTIAGLLAMSTLFSLSFTAVSAEETTAETTAAATTTTTATTVVEIPETDMPTLSVKNLSRAYPFPATRAQIPTLSFRTP